MKNEVATHVMLLVCYQRFKQHGLRKLMHDQKAITKSRKSIGAGGGPTAAELAANDEADAGAA